MKPEELEAAANAYSKNIPDAPTEEPTKFNSAQPHLLTEAVLVDLLAKTTVAKADVPEHLHGHWASFFKLDPQFVGKMRFQDFYNYLIEVL